MCIFTCNFSESYAPFKQRSLAKMYYNFNATCMKPNSTSWILMTKRNCVLISFYSVQLNTHICRKFWFMHSIAIHRVQHCHLLWGCVWACSGFVLHCLIIDNGIGILFIAVQYFKIDVECNRDGICSWLLSTINMSTYVLTINCLWWYAQTELKKYETKFRKFLLAVFMCPFPVYGQHATNISSIRIWKYFWQSKNNCGEIASKLLSY